MKARIGFQVFVYAIIPFISLSQEIADQLILNKEYEKAIREINRLITENPTAQLFHKKGMILRETFDYSGSLASFNQAVVLDQNNQNYLSDMADLLTSMGNTIDAVQVYRKAISVDGSNRIIKSRLGQLLINQREFAEAYQIYSGLREADTNNIFINKNLAIAAGRTGMAAQAIALFEQVIEANPRDLSSYVHLSSLYFQIEQFTRSNNTLKRGLEQFPGNSTLLLRLAQNLYTRRNFTEALPVYEEYLMNNPLTFDIRKEYGIVLYFNQKEEMALEVLEAALDEVPNDPFTALYMGLSFKKLKDYEMSKFYLNHAIESSTPYYLSDIYHHLGQVHGLMREFEASIEMLKKSYELDYTNHELLFEIATTYEEYNANKTLALNYYQLYLTEAREKALNANYALTRIKRIKEDMFFGE